MLKSVYYSEAKDLMDALAKFYIKASDKTSDEVDEKFADEVNTFTRNKFQEICDDLNITKVITLQEVMTITEMLN